MQPKGGGHLYAAPARRRMSPYDSREEEDDFMYGEVNDMEKPVIEWVDIIHGFVKKKMQAGLRTLAAHKGIMKAEWPENEEDTITGRAMRK